MTNSYRDGSNHPISLSRALRDYAKEHEGYKYILEYVPPIMPRESYMLTSLGHLFVYRLYYFIRDWPT